MKKFAKKYSSKQLIKVIQDKAVELGRTPKITEMNDDITNAFYVYQEHFGSWTNALKVAGLQLNVAKGEYSGKDLLEAIQKAYFKLGKVPTIDKMEKLSGIKRTQFSWRFGSWNKAVELAGFKPNQDRKPKRDKSSAFKNYSKEELIEYLKQYYKNNKSLLQADFQNKENLPSADFIQRKLELKKWTEVQGLILDKEYKKYRSKIEYKRMENLYKIAQTKPKPKHIIERPILQRDNDVDVESFKNFDREEYLVKQYLKKRKGSSGFTHFSKTGLLILLEQEFLRLGTIKKADYNLFKSNSAPSSLYYKNVFKISWDDMIELYFNEDGTLK